MKRRTNTSPNPNREQRDTILIAKSHIAGCYEQLGREDDLLNTRREVYLGMVELRGTSDYTTILAANQLMGALFKYDHSAEAMELLEKTIPQAERALGPDASVTLDLRWNYGYLSFSELRPPWDERTRKKEAQIKADLADLLQRKRRVLGSAHPNVLHCQQALARLPTAEALSAYVEGRPILNMFACLSKERWEIQR